MTWWLLFGVALIVSTVGFYRAVYFVSLGYAFSITAMVILTVWLFRDHVTWGNGVQVLGLGVWGLRLGLYTLRREGQLAYRREQQRVQQLAGDVGVRAKLLIWLGVSFLYMCMFIPAWVSLSVAPAEVAPWGGWSQMVGGVILLGGLSLETLADYQKSAFKAQFPSQFCQRGLYQWVRCPNYLGEILVWLGNGMMGLAFYRSWLWGGMSLLGLIAIVLIMMGATKRLERSQDERYGHLAEYQAYVRQVPVLFPFVPLYTLKHIRVYLE